MTLRILPTNIYLEALAAQQDIRDATTKPPIPLRQEPFLDTSVHVTISEAARRAAADAEARDRHVLHGLIPLHLKTFK